MMNEVIIEHLYLEEEFINLIIRNSPKSDLLKVIHREEKQTSLTLCYIDNMSLNMGFSIY